MVFEEQIRGLDPRYAVFGSFFGVATKLETVGNCYLCLLYTSYTRGATINRARDRK